MTEPTDDELLARFRSARLAPGEFRHREHLRVAYLYLVRSPDLALAAHRFRADLRRFAAALGAGTLFHETLTWAYLVLINQRIGEDRTGDSREFLAAHPELLDHRRGLLSRHYDVPALTASAAARRVFLLPGEELR